MIDIDEEDEDYGVAEQLEKHFTKVLESNVGDVVFYNFDTNKFSSASVVDGTKISAESLSTWKNTILLGIVLNQHEDRTVDVLMCGFLSAKPIRPPLSRICWSTSANTSENTYVSYTCDIYRHSSSSVLNTNRLNR